MAATEVTRRLWKPVLAALMVVAAVGALTAASAVAGAHRAGWTIQPTPNAKGAGTGTNRGSSLFGVSCTSASACTSVGVHTNAAGNDVLLAERWNGKRWSIEAMPSPHGAVTSNVGVVSCTSASACLAVGYYYNKASVSAVLAERWNGTKWTIQSVPTPSGASGAALNAVSCKSASACTAVGYYANSADTRSLTLAERWNGKRWKMQPTPNPSGGTGSNLTGISCASTSACTALGLHVNSSFKNLSFAERWNGKRWTITPTLNPSHTRAGTHLGGVSCTSASACTAVGEYSKAGGPVTLAERWNGTRWVRQSTPNPRTASGFGPVSCATASACTAVGDYTKAGAVLTLAERWNGTRWTVQKTPNPASAPFNLLNGVSCTSASACTAVGLYHNSSGTSFTLAERHS